MKDQGYVLLASGEKLFFEDGIVTLENIANQPYKMDICHVNIPDSVTSISSYCFFGCENLKTISLSKETSNLRIIGSYAFDGCTNLKEISIPNGLLHIGESAFAQTIIESIDFEDTELEYIGKNSFTYCEKLLKIKLSDKIDVINENCFYGCTSLMKVEGRRISYIGKNAFKECPDMSKILGKNEETVVVPEGNEKIEKDRKSVV